jgi:hypothetical protein
MTCSAALLIVLAGCSAADSTPSSPPSGGTASTSASTVAVTATPTPAIGKVPVGRIVFDRYRDGPEGMYLGTFLLDANGETQVDFPVDADEWSGVLSPGGQMLLVDAFSFDEGSFVGPLLLSRGS